jgi:glycosyltransferase involved in cell wall biosynthesis
MNAYTGGRDLPLITIGLTCFNAEETIRRAVESAIAQTWPHREVLVVDDGSSDGSRAVLAELEQAHDAVRVVLHDANRGFPAAVNTIVANAKGVFIAFFDDDDASVTSRLAEQYERIAGYETDHPGAPVLCYSNRTLVSETSGAAPRERRGIGRKAPEPHGPMVADFVLGLLKDDEHHQWGMFGSCTLMARSELIRDLDGFDVAFRRGAELDFAVRAAMHGVHFLSVDKPLITQFATQSADKAGNADLTARLHLLEKHRPYLKSKGAYLGAKCNMRAQHYCGKGRWWWRLWYAAALVCFPWPVARDRLRTSALLRLPARSEMRRGAVGNVE